MSVVIIGGGIAGLSCGCYLQMNGYQTQILEANPVPGGLCVSWDRGPYVFDGCMRWLVGTKPSSTFTRMWNELGAINGRPVLNYREFLRVEGANGQALSFTSDLNELAREAKRISPEDGPRIDALIRAARSCASLDPPAKRLELMSHWEKTRLLFQCLPMLITVARWKGKTVAEYVAAYRHPFLREALSAVAGDPRMSALVLIMVLGIREYGNVGYVAGGSRALAEAIERRYTDLGGVIRYHREATEISVEHDRAVGVLCGDGEFFPAESVVACADGYSAIFKMLGGKYVGKGLERLYREGEMFPPLVQASLGISRALNEVSESVSLPLPAALAGGHAGNDARLELCVMGEDCQLCPPGKTVVLARFASSFQYWAKLKAERPADYRAQKKQLLEAVIRLVDQRFPGVASAVEQADLATPVTYVRYTGNREGSCQGWLPTPRVLHRPIPQSLPGLQNFYMAGHWVQAGGGLPPAALSGCYAAQSICAKDGKPFRTKLP